MNKNVKKYIGIFIAPLVILFIVTFAALSSYVVPSIIYSVAALIGGARWSKLSWKMGIVISWPLFILIFFFLVISPAHLNFKEFLFYFALPSILSSIICGYIGSLIARRLFSDHATPPENTMT